LKKLTKLKNSVNMLYTILVSSVVACPGSHSPIHAGAKIDIEFSNSCAEVAEEIKMRAQAPATQWQDPHNHGTYTLEKAEGNTYIKVKRVTKNKVFTDRSDFTLTDNGSGGCSVKGCSESQGISAADSGTNFCDMYSLFCNKQDCSGGTCCKVLKNDLKYTISKKSCYPFFFNCPGNTQNQRDTCLKMPSTEEQLAELHENAIMLTRMGAFKSIGDFEEETEE